MRLMKQDIRGLQTARPASRQGRTRRAPNWQGKIELDFARLVPGARADRLAMTAILMPHVSRSPSTSFRPASAREAMLAMAPSSLYQLYGSLREDFGLIASIVRALPAFHLDLSEDPAEIAAAIRAFMEQRGEMKISIHMPAYNAEATIGSALKSLLRQRGAGASRSSSSMTARPIAPAMSCAPWARGAGDPADQRGPWRHPESEECGAAGHGAGHGSRGLPGRGRLVAGRTACAGRGRFRGGSGHRFHLFEARFFDIEDTETLAPSVRSHAVDGRTVNLAAGLFRRRVLEQVGPFDEGLVQAEVPGLPSAHLRAEAESICYRRRSVCSTARTMAALRRTGAKRGTS